MAFSLKNKIETALGITNLTNILISTLLKPKCNLDHHRNMRQWEGSLAGLAFAKHTVDKQNHKVSCLFGETRIGVEKDGNLSEPSQSRQTYGRMFNLLSSPCGSNDMHSVQSYQAPSVS